MSQQYGPPGTARTAVPPPGCPGHTAVPRRTAVAAGRSGDAADRAAAADGWGPAPGQRPRKSSRTQWIVMGGAVLAVVLIATGVVVMVTGGKRAGAAPVAADTRTPDPVGTLYTPPTPSPTKPVITKGPYDTGRVDRWWGLVHAGQGLDQGPGQEPVRGELPAARAWAARRDRRVFLGAADEADGSRRRSRITWSTSSRTTSSTS